MMQHIDASRKIIVRGRLFDYQIFINAENSSPLMKGRSTRVTEALGMSQHGASAVR
jgi:hypothetical protein